MANALANWPDYERARMWLMTERSSSLGTRFVMPSAAPSGHDTAGCPFHLIKTGLLLLRFEPNHRGRNTNLASCTHLTQHPSARVRTVGMLPCLPVFLVFASEKFDK